MKTISLLVWILANTFAPDPDKGWPIVYEATVQGCPIVVFTNGIWDPTPGKDYVWAAVNPTCEPVHAVVRAEVYTHKYQ